MAASTLISQVYVPSNALVDEYIGIHRVEVTDATTSDLVVRSGLIDGAVMAESAADAAPSFSVNTGTLTVSITSGTIGNRWTILTRHIGPNQS